MSETSIAVLLGRLHTTLRTQLVPLSADGHLTSELLALASILRILASEASTLDELDRADRAAAADCAEALGVTVVDDSRRALARYVQKLGSQAAEVPEPIVAYRRENVARGYAPLITTGGRWNDDETTAERPPSVRDRLDDLLPAIADLVGWPRDGKCVLERKTEGFAAETVMVRHPSVSDHGVVLRVQWPQFPLSRMLVSVELQAMALVEVGSTLRVPSVIGVLDADVIGAPVLVTTYEEGRVPTNWNADGRALTRELADRGAWKDLVDDLVALQGVNWQTSVLRGLRGQGNRRAWHLERIDRLEYLYRSAALRPDVLVEEVLVYLRSEAGHLGDEVLVHSDFRPGNMIYPATGRPVIIDWDGVTIGDHHEDLGVTLLDIHRGPDGKALGMVSDAQLVETYVDRSGREVLPEGLQYAKILAAFRRCVGFHLIARGWIDGGGDIRMARVWLAIRNDRAQLGALLDEA